MCRASNPLSGLFCAVLYPICSLAKRWIFVLIGPLGSHHPKHTDMIYPVNYGYVPHIFSADGEEVDVYLLGVSEPVEKYKGRVIAVIHRLDDVEDKWIAAPSGVTFTPDEIEKAVNFQEQYFRHEIEIYKADEV